MPPKPAVAKATKDRDALKSLLETSSSRNVQRALIAALTNSTDEQVKALSDMLSSVAKAASTQKHCVRCHDPFFENQNHPKACTIKHNSEADADRAEIGSDTMVAELACCGYTYNPEEENPSNKPCIFAAHTSNPEDVDYFDGDQGEGNENVITCGEKGCTKKKRKGASTSGLKKKK
ncbi:hypothetical protein FIBSPDRAFT_935384 [Athelia psychrophila]|uniref:C2H2-type domain-containing protein n=1 Tax=Athelia psychrophila TaxID=1759441 RepID=A0A166DWT9_9AGAM|nr:hypothetical protein FIBSPDRAFT_935384 [Fibularhizoctonia sp. CBS 109695]